MQDTSSQHIRLNLPRTHFTLDVDLHLPTRGITVLFGESGSGKTSLLRCVAGLERAENALVQMAGQCWQNDQQGLFVPTWQRQLGYVFQESSLFAHLSVQDNLEYGLRRLGATPRDPRVWLRKRLHRNRQELAPALIPIVQLLGIEHLLKQRPHQLSGGERQRVAIARALATNPQVLLLDEPLASLDTARRHEVLPWLERLRDELAIPMLYVTHSLEELERLADHVVILQRGRCVASDAPDVLHNTGIFSTFTTLEPATWLKGKISAYDPYWQRITVLTQAGSFEVPQANTSLPAHSFLNKTATLKIQARDVLISRQAPSADTENVLLASIQSMSPTPKHPGHSLLTLQIADQQLLALVHNKRIEDLALQVGTLVFAILSRITTSSGDTF